MVKRIYFKVVIIISLSALLTTCRLEGDIEALRKKLVENHVPSDVPSAPSAPALTVGDKQITVTWTAVHEATTYEVWLSTKNNSATAANMAVVSGTTVTLNNLTNGTTYYVWLKAKNSVGTSDFSPVTSGIPSIPITTAPQAPLTPTVSTSDGQITVTWTAVQGATAYEIWLGTENNSVTAAKRGEDVSGTSVTLTNLTNGTTYYVWVRAKNDTGTSGFSPVASGTPFIPVTAPQSPSTPAVSIGNEQITVTW
ncbi:MAG: fibronectin type III domain-containing protein, partial [Treponema sp.]|nr:fibronectin type III domain-containing protein [Treponema sp.]